MTPTESTPPRATLEHVLEVFTDCLEQQRDALVRGDLSELRRVQGRLQDALQDAKVQADLSRASPQQRSVLRDRLRDALSLCAINASLTARAETGVRRARSALGQAEPGLYGSGGESLLSPPRAARRFGV